MFETSEAARQRREDLIAMRIDLNGIVAAVEERRRTIAFAAATGDEAAAAELSKIDGEEAQARSDLRNLEFAIVEAGRKVDEAYKRAAADRELAEAQARSEAIGDLLDLDDLIDDALDYARDLLQARSDHIKERKITLIEAADARAIGQTLGMYFDRYLGSASYAEIERVAERDGRAFGRKSPGVEKRGPRPLTAVEKSLIRLANVPTRSATGFDSVLESEKLHAAR